jgi:hypothetical protein
MRYFYPTTHARNMPVSKGGVRVTSCTDGSQAQGSGGLSVARFVSRALRIKHLSRQMIDSTLLPHDARAPHACVKKDCACLGTSCTAAWKQARRLLELIRGKSQLQRAAPQATLGHCLKTCAHLTNPIAAPTLTARSRETHRSAHYRVASADCLRCPEPSTQTLAEPK